MAQRIVQRIKEYCKAGLLDGMVINATFFGAKYRMINVRIGEDGDVFFDHLFFNGKWEECQTCARVRNQVTEYLRDCLEDIEKQVKIDKNLF